MSLPISLQETVLLAAFFLSLTLGVMCDKLKIGFFKPGKFTMSLVFSLIIGYAASRMNILDFPKLSSAVSVMKQTLFLIFIFATGYSSGPGVVNLFKNVRRNRSFIAVVVCSVFMSLSAAGVIFFIRKSGLVTDSSLLTGIASGTLTQTAILGVSRATSSSGVTGLDRDVVFTVLYTASTILTMLFCCSVFPGICAWFCRKEGAGALLNWSVEKFPDNTSKHAISNKILPVPSRCGRAYTVNPALVGTLWGELKEQLNVHHLTIQAIFDRNGVFIAGRDCSNVTVKNQDVVFVLGDRSKMLFAADILGEERVELPESWQQHFKFKSQSVSLRRDMKIGDIREILYRHNVFLEQIISPEMEEQDRFELEALVKKHSKIKLFGIEDDLAASARDMHSFLIPKDKNSGVMVIGLSIFAALAITLSIPFAASYIGSGLLTFIAGIAVGSFRELYPRRIFGFPPQASQLFQTFGMCGYLVLSGLAASGNVIRLVNVGEIPDGTGSVVLAAVLLLVIPTGLTAILALVLLKNPALAMAALAGSRSSTVAYEALEDACGNAPSSKVSVLESAFTVSYAISNFLLTTLGVWI